MMNQALYLYFVLLKTPRAPARLSETFQKHLCVTLLTDCVSLAVTLESLLWSPLSLPQVQCYLFPPFFMLCLLSSTQVSCCNLCDVLFSREAAGSNTWIYSLRCTTVNTLSKKEATRISLYFSLSHTFTFCLLLSLHCTTRTYLNAYESDRTLTVYERLLILINKLGNQSKFLIKQTLVYL